MLHKPLHNKIHSESAFSQMGPGGVFLPNQLAGLVAWYKYGKGITVTGSGVSQWDDASGNENHLLQAVDASRPAKQGDGSILFDGVTDYLKTAAFTLNQPETIYLLMKQTLWVNTVRMCDGNAGDDMAIWQGESGDLTPTISNRAGLAGAKDTSNMIIDEYHVVSTIFNGASSLIQVDLNTPGTGNAGTSNGGGFTLGAHATGAAHSHIQVKEVFIFNKAHDAATREKNINYLKRIGGLSF